MRVLRNIPSGLRHSSIKLQKTDRPPCDISTMKMGSIRESKTYLKNAASLEPVVCSLRVLNLSKEVLEVSVDQRATKLWSIIF